MILNVLILRKTGENICTREYSEIDLMLRLQVDSFQRLLISRKNRLVQKLEILNLDPIN